MCVLSSHLVCARKVFPHLLALSSVPSAVYLTAAAASSQRSTDMSENLDKADLVSEHLVEVCPV